MKKIISSICLVCFLGAWNPVFSAVRVPAGTSIPITIEHEVTSKTVASGGAIDAIIAEDVIINNNVVFKKGDGASITVLSANKAGFIGKPGEIALYGGKVYDAKGNEHKFDFNRQIVGDEKTWPKACLGVSIFFLWPLALCAFVKGGQAKLNPLPPIETRLSTEFMF